MTNIEDTIFITDRVSGKRLRSAVAPFPKLPDDLEGHRWAVIAKGGRYALFTWIARKVTGYDKSNRFTRDRERTYIVDLETMNFRLMWEVDYGHQTNASYDRWLTRLDLENTIAYWNGTGSIINIDLATADTSTFPLGTVYSWDHRFYASSEGIRDVETYRLVIPLIYEWEAPRRFSSDGKYLFWSQPGSAVIYQHRLTDSTITTFLRHDSVGLAYSIHVTNDGLSLIAICIDGIVRFDTPPIDKSLQVLYQRDRLFYKLNDIPQLINSSLGDAQGVTFRWEYHDDSVSYAKLGDRIYRDSGQFSVRLVASRDGVDIGSYVDSFFVYSTKWAQIHFRDTALGGIVTWTQDGKHLIVSDYVGSYRVVSMDKMFAVDSQQSPGLDGIALPIDHERVGQWYLSRDTINLVWCIRDLNGTLLQKDSVPVLPSISNHPPDKRRDIKLWRVYGAICDSGRSAFIGMKTDYSYHPGFLMEFRAVPGGMWPWADIDTTVSENDPIRHASVEVIISQWNSPVAYVRTSGRYILNGVPLYEQVRAYEAGTGLKQYRATIGSQPLTTYNVFTYTLMHDLCTISSSNGLYNFWDNTLKYWNAYEGKHSQVRRSAFHHSWRVASILETTYLLELRIYSPDSAFRHKVVQIPYIVQKRTSTSHIPTSSGMDVSPDDRFVAVSTTSSELIVFDLRVIPETERIKPTFFLPKDTRQGSPDRFKSRLFESNGRLRFRTIASPDTGISSVRWDFGATTNAASGADVHHGFSPGVYDVQMHVTYADRQLYDTLRPRYIEHGTGIVPVTDSEQDPGRSLIITPHPVSSDAQLSVQVADPRITTLRIYSLQGELIDVIDVEAGTASLAGRLVPGLYTIRGESGDTSCTTSATFIVR